MWKIVTSLTLGGEIVYKYLSSWHNGLALGWFLSSKVHKGESYALGFSSENKYVCCCFKKVWPGESKQALKSYKDLNCEG